ncbi:MAG TPA: formate dehydrogenase accessory sulfurtransferase FdhD [Firmicutes bacterium]|nr:formate dehydrogenase accessory sulfurtransferase FdhD [Bacillota bacterium]
MNPVDTFDILRYKDGEWLPQGDLVIREAPVTIYVNGQELVTMLATPQYLDELALGYLYAEGFLAGIRQVEKVAVDRDNNVVRVFLGTGIDRSLKLYGRRLLTSGCGRGSVFYQSLDALEIGVITSLFSVSPEQVGTLVRQFQDSSLLFRQTGGVHGAALAGKGKIILFREDIGRHNAVDKIAGRCLLEGLEVGDKLLLTTGRVSSEIVLKTAKLGVPLLVSPSAPTDLAVQTARRLQLTLVGFARGKRLNVYSGAWRLGYGK